MVHLDEFENRIHSEHDLASVLHIMRRQARDMGVVRQGYFFIPVFDTPNSPRTNIYTVGFPDGWVHAYLHDGLRDIDPLPAATLASGRLMFWSEILDKRKERPSVAKFAKAMEDHQLLHGFGVPLFGPNARCGYAFFDFDRPRDQLDTLAIFTIRTMAQITHQRICQILDSQREVPALSAREREVLDWMAQGKSSTIIAEILEISPETVRTYSQRVYQKLGANDRTSATLRGLKLGLIRKPMRNSV